MASRGAWQVFVSDRLISHVGKQEVIAFFKPCLFAVVLTGMFIPIALAGHVQTYGYTCGGDGHKCVGTGIEKPLFYDELRGYPFWSIWVFSIVPLIPFTSALQSAVSNIEGLYIFFAVNFAYYYVGSCVLAFFGRKLRTIKWFDDPPQQIKSS